MEAGPVIDVLLIGKFRFREQLQPDTSFRRHFK